MSTILFLTTLVLGLAGVVFSGSYIWLNVFSRITDVTPRNGSLLKLTKSSMILSNIFALLSCLLANADAVTAALDRAGTLYTILAVGWLAVLLACGGSMLYVFLSRGSFRGDAAREIRRLSAIALWGAGLGAALSWLFS